jgi:hypothetical protein
VTLLLFPFQLHISIPLFGAPQMRMTSATFSGLGIEADVHLFGQNFLNAKKEFALHVHIVPIMRPL